MTDEIFVNVKLPPNSTGKLFLAVLLYDPKKDSLQICPQHTHFTSEEVMAMLAKFNIPDRSSVRVESTNNEESQ